jgi:hypothetical protein
VITARRTRLVRVPDLQAFRRVIAALTVGNPLIVVPTRNAGRQLARTVGGAPAEIVTRDQMYDALGGRLSDRPVRLTAFARDGLAQAAAAVAARETPDL